MKNPAIFTKRTLEVSLLTLVFAFMLFQLPPAYADTIFQLSGRVTNQLGNPLAGTTVDVIDPDPVIGGTVASAFADVNGEYTLSVAGGTYDVRVTPPAGSGFGTAIALSRTINSDTILDFVLVPAGSVILSGRVLDPLGNGIPDQEIYLAAEGTGNWTRSTTDTSGDYSFEVSPGDYDLTVTGNNPPSPPVNAPRQYYLYASSLLTLTESMIMDIPLSGKKVTVRVQDPGGNPVANVSINTNYAVNGDLFLGILPAYGNSSYPNGSPPATTNASGDAILWLFPTPSDGDAYTFTATPPPGSPFATFSVHDVTVVSDKTIIIVFQFVHDPPVTAASVAPDPDEQGVYPDPVTITLSATAASGFTVAATYYSVDGGPDQTYTDSFVVSGDGDHTIEYWSVDDLGVYETPKTLTFQIVSNQPPVADAGGPYSVNEGSSIILDASGSSDPDGDPLQYQWDFNNDGTPDTGWSSSPTASYTWNDDWAGTAKVEVSDGILSSTDTVSVTVNNVAPVVNAGPGATIDEGDTFASSGSFTDPGADEWTATVDYDDGGGAQSLALNLDNTFSLSYLYADNGTYTVTVTVTDDDGGAGSDTAVVTVNNVAPTVDAGPNASIAEGSAFNSSGSFADPGADTWTATVNYGDSPVVQPLSLIGKTFALNHVYADNGTYTVTVTVTDDDDGVGTDTLTVTVNNVVPSLSAITVPVDLVEVGTAITPNATFTDPGAADTHKATWDWDDGNTDTIDPATSPVNGSHAYSDAGVYTLTLTVTDDDLGSDTKTYQYVVVYDPSGGFVTGGGWIDSPAGAYMPAPSLEGKANFGFVSKYKKGAEIPTGQTQFNFHAPGMNFHSTAYQWLVVAGAQAKYKGSGTINGEGDYGFMLSAVDGEVQGGGEGDKFWIKIWDKDTEEVVYDNQIGDNADEDPATYAIGGGSIIIHGDEPGGSKKTTAAAPSRLPEVTDLPLPFPNPANPEVWIPYQLGSDNQVVIRIYSMTGRLVRTLDLGYRPAGFYASRSKAAYWDGSNEAGERVASGIYFYSFQAGQFTATRKILISK